MSQWYDREIKNKNYLSPIGFRLLIQKAPKVSFMCQDVSIPSINLGSVELPYRGFVTTPIEGNIKFEDFTVEFLVDEDLENWLEIYDWIRGLGVAAAASDRFDYLESKFKIGGQSDMYRAAKGNEKTSDTVLMVQNNNYALNFEIVLRDCFPISLTPLPFNVTGSDNNYMTARATFRYTYYDVYKSYDASGDPTRGG